MNRATGRGDGSPDIRSHGHPHLLLCPCVWCLEPHRRAPEVVLVSMGRELFVVLNNLSTLFPEQCANIHSPARMLEGSQTPGSEYTPVWDLPFPTCVTRYRPRMWKQGPGDHV